MPDLGFELAVRRPAPRAVPDELRASSLRVQLGAEPSGSRERLHHALQHSVAGAVAQRDLRELRATSKRRRAAVPDRVGLQDQSSEPVREHFPRRGGDVAQRGRVHDLAGALRARIGAVPAGRQPPEAARAQGQRLVLEHLPDGSRVPQRKAKALLWRLPDPDLATKPPPRPARHRVGPAAARRPHDHPVRRDRVPAPWLQELERADRSADRQPRGRRLEPRLGPIRGARAAWLA
jgi:hypothetical protein